MTGQPTKVYPIPGRFIVGVPLTEQELPTKQEAEALVATGAFALSEKEANEQAFSTPEAKPASTDNVKNAPAAEPAAEPAAGSGSAERSSGKDSA